MARKDRLDTTALKNYGGGSGGNQPDPEQKKSNVNPRSLANLRPRAKGRSDKKYMQLDIIEFEDYLNRMSKYKKTTRTKYIQELIRQDKKQHEDEYALLVNLSEFDKKR